MHKKLIQELNSLAHDVLKMRDKNDILAIKGKVSGLYEKINLLAYLEEYVNTTPHLKETKEELMSKYRVTEFLEKDNGDEIKSMVSNGIEQKDVENDIKLDNKEPELEYSELLEEEDQELICNDEKTENIQDIEVNDTEDSKIFENDEIEEDDENEEVVNSDDTTYDEEQPTVVEWELSLEEQKQATKISLEEELGDTVHVDVVSDMFSKEESMSLNDKLRSKLHIGLNDRLAFVHHLFKWNQSEFNKMIKEIDHKETLDHALEYIKEKVKPNYDWSDVEEYEERLYEIIKRKFN